MERSDRGRGIEIHEDEPLAGCVGGNFEKSIDGFVEVRNTLEAWRLNQAAFRVVRPSMVFASCERE